MEPIIGYCALGAAMTILLVSFHVRKSGQKAAAGTFGADSGSKVGVKELMKMSFIKLDANPKTLQTSLSELNITEKGSLLIVENGLQEYGTWVGQQYNPMTRTCRKFVRR